MEYWKYMGLCALCVVPVLYLKGKTPELAYLVTLAALGVCGVGGLSAAAKVWQVLEDLFGRAGIPTEHVSILLRTVGAALLSRVCADLCRDGGSQALAAVVETVGSAAMLLIALPLLQAVTELLLELMP